MPANAPGRRFREPDPAAATHLVLAQDPEDRELQFRLVAPADPAARVELAKEVFMPAQSHLPHRSIVGAVLLAVVVTAVSGVLAAGVAPSASASGSRSALRSPSPAAIRYLKRHLVGWARQRSAFWNGYLAGGPFHFAACGYDSSGPLVTYGCTLDDVGGARLAIFVLGRISSTCSYGFTFGAPSAHRQFTRTFRYCG